MTTKVKKVDRTRYDPNEDYMPAVSAIEASRQAYFDEHPESAPSQCPIPACGQFAYGVGKPCPMSDKLITGKYGTGLHPVAFMVARKLPRLAEMVAR